MDTVVKIVDGVRWHFYQAIDVKGKVGLSLPYKRLSAKNTVDFFKKFQFLLPYKIHTVQTDNGAEFLGVFRGYLAKNKIRQLFIYPRCYRVNGVVERFNRTMQDNFIDYNLHLVHDQQKFQRELADFLIFLILYNTKRGHESLNGLSPVEFLQQQGMSNMSRSCTCT